MPKIVDNPKEAFPIRGNIATIPIEWLPFFIDDPANAAMEYLSIPRGAVNPFFHDIDKLRNAIDHNLKNPINWDTYAIDGDWKAKDNRPRYMHIDLAKSGGGDGTGMAMAHVHGVKDVYTRNNKGKFERVKLPVIQYDFMAVLRPRRSHGETEMDYDNILDIIFDVASRGFNLSEGIISFDSWQSHHLKTTLTKEGFNLELLSIDHTTHKLIVDFNQPSRVRKELISRTPAAAMNALRDVIHQDRVIFCDMPNYPERDVPYLEKEAGDMQAVYGGQQNVLKAVKVEGGSDDLIQACAGACFHAVNNYEYIVPDSVTENANVRRNIERFERAFYKQFGIGIEDDGRIPQDVIDNAGYEGRRKRSGDDYDSFYDDLILHEINM